jgi:hypothetical protein
MSYNNAVIRNRKTKNKEQRLHFVLEDDLRNELFDVAQANYVSVSHFVRESVRRNINLYKKTLSV